MNTFDVTQIDVACSEVAIETNSVDCLYESQFNSSRKLVTTSLQTQ